MADATALGFFSAVRDDDEPARTVPRPGVGTVSGFFAANRDVDEKSDLAAVVAEIDAVPERAPGTPMAIAQADWDTVPEGRREETVERYAFFMMRGETPEAAFGKTVSTMDLDEEDAMDGLDWRHVRRLVRVHSQPARDGNYRPHWSIVRDAAMIAEAANAEIVEPGAVSDPKGYLGEMGLSGAYLDAAVETFRAIMDERLFGMGVTQAVPPALGHAEEPDPFAISGSLRTESLERPDERWPEADPEDWEKDDDEDS